MKILYLSHHREISGWGRSCKDYLKALLSTGVDVVSRPILVNNRISKVEDQIEKSDRKDVKGCTHVIQYVLPFHMSYNGSFEKNIGISLFETHNIRYTKFPSFINLLDEFWFPNNPDIPEIKITKKEMLQPLDLSIYQKEYPRISFKKYNENYKFYTICELSKRKNLTNLIRVYYSTFNHNDNVSLVLKLNHPSMDNRQIREYMTNHCMEIAQKCKKYKKFEDYPKVEIVSEFLPEENLFGLHQSCDCYISSSYGEAICYPMLDAAGFNKPVISVDNKYNSYFDYVNASVCKSVEEFTFDQMDTFPDYNTSKEKWYNFDQLNMSNLMKNMYMTNCKKSLTKINELDYNIIGKKMIGEILC